MIDEHDSAQRLVEMWSADPTSCVVFAVVIIGGLLAIIWVVHQYHQRQRE